MQETLQMLLESLSNIVPKPKSLFYVLALLAFYFIACSEDTLNPYDRESKLERAGEFKLALHRVEYMRAAEILDSIFLQVNEEDLRDKLAYLLLKLQMLDRFGQHKKAYQELIELKHYCIQSNWVYGALRINGALYDHYKSLEDTLGFRNIFTDSKELIRNHENNQVIRIEFLRHQSALAYAFNDSEQYLNIARQLGSLDEQNEWVQGPKPNLFNLGLIYYKSGRYEEALNSFLKVENLSKEDNDSTTLCNCYNFLGKIHRKQSKMEEAINYFFASKKFCEPINDFAILSVVYKALYEIYYQKRDYEKSVNFLEEYNRVKLADMERALNSQFELNQVELKLLEKEKQLQNETLKARLVNISLISLFLISLAIGLILFQRLRSNKIQYEQNQKIQLIENQKAIAKLESENAEYENRLIKSNLHFSDFLHRKFAGILHDELAGLVVGAKIALGLLPQSKSDAKIVNDVMGNMDKLYSYLRDASHSLMPFEVETPNFVSRMEEYFEIHSKLDVIIIAVDNPNIDLLFTSLKTEIFRIVNELVLNANKHSNGSKIWVNIHAKEDLIILSVEDDGVGIRLTSAKIMGIGLQQLKERVAMLKGSVRSSNIKDGGFKTVVSIPLVSKVE